MFSMGWLVGIIISIGVVIATGFSSGEPAVTPTSPEITIKQEIVPQENTQQQLVQPSVQETTKITEIPAKYEAKVESSIRTNKIIAEPKEESRVISPKAQPAPKTSSCHPSYSGCLKQNAGDYDCESGTGDGPNYTGAVQVYGSDPFGLDRDHDGWACE